MELGCSGCRRWRTVQQFETANGEAGHALPDRGQSHAHSHKRSKGFLADRETTAHIRPVAYALFPTWDASPALTVRKATVAGAEMKHWVVGIALICTGAAIPTIADAVAVGQIDTF